MNLKFGSLIGAIALATALSGCSVSIGGSTLDTQKAEDEIATGIQDQTGIAVTVSCPEDVEIMAGAQFTCTATDSDGNQGPVTVTQEDDEGNVQWDLEGDNTLGGNNLNVRNVEAEIVKGLQDQAGITATVDCPTTVPIEAGTSFNCTAHDEDGETATVVVTQTDDKGNINWEIK